MKTTGDFTFWQKMSSASATDMQRSVGRIAKQQRGKAKSTTLKYTPAKIGERGVAGLKGHKIRCAPPDDYDPRDNMPLSQRMRELP